MTPEKVVDILKEHGTLVTIDEAKVILNYFTQAAEFEVAEFLKREKEKKISTIDKNIHPG
jgi:hypothetical protein